MTPEGPWFLIHEEVRLDGASAFQGKITQGGTRVMTIGTQEATRFRIAMGGRCETAFEPR